MGTGCRPDEGDGGGLLEEVRFEQRLEDEGSRLVDSWGTRIPGRGISQNKGPEKGQCLTCLRTRKYDQMGQHGREPLSKLWLLLSKRGAAAQFDAEDGCDLTDVLFKQKRKLLDS